MRLRVAELDRLLLSAEQHISLLERCTPCNFQSESRAVDAAWRQGQPRNPRFEYASHRSLFSLQKALAQVVERASQGPALLPLYAARAEELRLEAELAQNVGKAAFSRLASRRFSVPADSAGVQAQRWSETWLKEHREVDELQPLIPVEDTSDERSLVSLMAQAIGEQRLPFRIEFRPGLASMAATGEGVIVIRHGAKLSENRARRIVLHEVFGHALPRAQARREPCRLFSAGTARGPDEEEGRALLLEERHDLLSPLRRAELARRHLGALSVRQGADWVQTVELLLSSGASLAEAQALAHRSHRGGGLARELVYLPAFWRLREAFRRTPTLERWFERGRVSLASIPRLSRFVDSETELGCTSNRSPSLRTLESIDVRTVLS